MYLRLLHVQAAAHEALQPCKCRGQCTHILEDAEAMKAHAQLHGTYNESAAKGRPVLHAALQAEKLVCQLVTWATQLPLFATQIIGQSLQTEPAMCCGIWM